MAVIVKTIGSAVGRDFASIPDWFASIPTDVVASGNSYVGNLYNDSIFSISATITFSGKTTSSTNTITLEAAPLNSFSDNPNRQTNALAYNTANGVALSGSIASNGVLLVNQSYMTIRGLQINNTNNGSSVRTIYSSAVTTGMIVENCIVQSAGNGNSATAVEIYSGLIRNSLIICSSGNSRAVGFGSSKTGLAGNITAVRPAGVTHVSGQAFAAGTSGSSVVNCASFGFGQFSSHAFVGSNNGTDLATISFGTDNLVSLVYADQFVSTTSGALDLRLKAGSSLIDAGIARSNTSSIASVTRPSGNAFDIGAWEYIQLASTITASAGSGYVGVANRIDVVLNGAITSAVTISFSGTGGTFSASSVTIPAGSMSGFVNFTPTTAGNKTITITNNGGLQNPSPLVFSVNNVGLVMNVVTNFIGTPSIVNVSVNGTMNQTVTVTPSASDGAPFSPPTITLSPSTLSGSFQYSPTVAGVKTISLTNSGTLTNPGPATINVVNAEKVRNPNPTPSSQGFRVVSVGAGKDYATFNDFRTYLATVNLITNNEILLAEVYDDQSIGAMMVGPPSTGQDTTHYCIIRPVRGCSEAEMNPNGQFNYGIDGVQLSITNTLKLARGVTLEGFRIDISGSGRIAIGASSSSGNGGRQFVQRNRIRLSGSLEDAFNIGEYAIPGNVVDNLIIRTSGTSLLSAYSTCNISRNTFIALNNATGPIVKITSSNGRAENNAFINVGPVPYSSTQTTVPLAANYTNVAMTTPISGFIVNTTTPFVVDSANDFRPASNSPLLGNATASANSINDQRGGNRGINPDVGSYQLVPASPLPSGMVTGGGIPDGQKLTVNFSTQNNPTSSMATLSPSATNPAGAQTNTGSVTLGSNVGTAIFSNIAPGNYVLTITVSNDGGPAVVSGTQPVSILEISGTPQAPGSGVIPEATEPSTPINVTATPRAGGVLVNGFVSSNGGSPITSYTAIASTGQSATSNTLPVFVPMPDGVIATFTLIATNTVGSSEQSFESNPASALAPVAPTVPGAPAISATAGVETVFVNVSPPDDDGNSPILSYTVTLSNGQSITQPGTEFTFDDLPPVSVTATAFATNAVGNGPISEVSNSVTPIEPPVELTEPGPPIIGVAVARNGAIEVNFLPPLDDGGSTITNYTVLLSNGGIGFGTASPIIVDSENFLSVSANVSATNAIGTGPASEYSNFVTPIPATYSLESYDPSVIQRYTTTDRLRIRLTFVDEPAPKSRTIIVGGSSTTITSG